MAGPEGLVDDYDYAEQDNGLFGLRTHFNKHCKHAALHFAASSQIARTSSEASLALPPVVSTDMFSSSAPGRDATTHPCTWPSPRSAVRLPGSATIR